MKNTLRTVLSAAVLAAAAALAPHSASAASPSVTVKVPFTFSASGKLCPAGVYTVRSDELGQVVRLWNSTNRVGFVWTAGPGEPSPSSARVVLRFDRVGPGYALRSVQYGSQITSQLDRNIPSKAPSLALMGR